MKIVLETVIVLGFFRNNLCQLICDIQNCNACGLTLSKLNRTCVYTGGRNCIKDYVSDKVIHRAKPRNLELKVKNKIWTVSWDPPYGTNYSGFRVVIGHGFSHDIFYLEVDRQKQADFVEIACHNADLFQVCVKVLPEPISRTQQKTDYCYPNSEEWDNEQSLITEAVEELGDYLQPRGTGGSGHSSHRGSIIGATTIACALVLSIVLGVALFRYRNKIKQCLGSQEGDIHDPKDCPVHGRNEKIPNNYPSGTGNTLPEIDFVMSDEIEKHVRQAKSEEELQNLEHERRLLMINFQ